MGEEVSHFSPRMTQPGRYTWDLW